MNRLRGGESGEKAHAQATAHVGRDTEVTSATLRAGDSRKRRSLGVLAMNVYENMVNCIEVENVSSVLRQYEQLGCGVKAIDNEGCLTLGCGNEDIRVCQRSDEGSAVTTA